LEGSGDFCFDGNLEQRAMNAIACAAFLIAAFVLAGFAQTAWFATPLSRRIAVPLDGGLTVRGRRLFGANKTLRGFIVMIPATAASFALLAKALGCPLCAGLWPMTPAEYARLGAWAAFGFMVGELPNSFVKRQLDIGPGDAAQGHGPRRLQFAIDRADSGIGMLTAVTLAVPTPALTWLIVLAAGLWFHWGFSVLMFRLGIKPRPA
jgi:CDP-2,3-bis-(O-geranylgeranyl)-sn-glycerol synthase